jgi:hypothetical protein
VPAQSVLDWKPVGGRKIFVVAVAVLSHRVLETAKASSRPGRSASWRRSRAGIEKREQMTGVGTQPCCSRR